MSIRALQRRHAHACVAVVAVNKTITAAYAPATRQRKDRLARTDTRLACVDEAEEPTKQKQKQKQEQTQPRPKRMGATFTRKRILGNHAARLQVARARLYHSVIRSKRPLFIYRVLRTTLKNKKG